MENNIQILKRIFRKTYCEVDCLEEKCLKRQEGCIFESYEYTWEEICKKIYLITNEIKIYLEDLLKTNKLSEEEINIYYNEKTKLDDKLHRLNLKIINRKLTPQERIIGTINSTKKNRLTNILISFIEDTEWFDILSEQEEAFQEKTVKLSEETFFLLSKDTQREVSFLLASLLTLSSLLFLYLSIIGLIFINWKFFAATFFSSLGVASSSLLILLGVDREFYE